MRFIKRTITPHKGVIRKSYVLLKRVAKRIDQHVVRILSFGKLFKPSKVVITEGDLKIRLQSLHEIDVSGFELYNKSTSPPITVKVYNKCKTLLRKLLGKIKNLVKKVLT